MTIQSKRSNLLNRRGSSIGSIESQRTPDLTLANPASAAATLTWRSTVVPIQAFGGMSNSDIRLGNLVRQRKFHSGAARISRRTALIHSSGTQRPNTSAIDPVNTL